MSNLAIRVDGLAKRYRLGGAQVPYRTLRESIMDGMKAPLRWRRRTGPAEEAAQTLWALSDVSFEVKHGEVVGIIGRNGAGKSTLLKILSRITEPTRGGVDIYGQLSALLEVGSGFHPELTGRENIYLNGSILGMRRSDIRKRFDAIVAFAEVERFVDTAVKHYSSGMYLRLAFAVAAHLEPEILVVDEVLAVGDFDFQRKCLGKMQDVANEGRTVLFVSHNMGAVQHLCSRGILLQAGRVIMDSTAVAAVNTYLRIGLDETGERRWADDAGAPQFLGLVRFRSIRSATRNGTACGVFDVKDDVMIEVEYAVLETRHSLNVHLYVRDEGGETMFVAMDNLDSPWRDSIQPRGRYRAQCLIPANLLNEGTVRVDYLICTRPTLPGHFVCARDAISFQVTDDRSPVGVRGNWSRDWPKAVVRPRCAWTVTAVD